MHFDFRNNSELNRVECWINGRMIASCRNSNDPANSYDWDLSNLMDNPHRYSSDHKTQMVLAIADTWRFALRCNHII